LVADEKYKDIIHANGFTPTDISMKLCKDLYAQVNAQSHIMFDAQSFVEAGEMMQQHGGGFFRYGQVTAATLPYLRSLSLLLTFDLSTSIPPSFPSLLTQHPMLTSSPPYLPTNRLPLTERPSTAPPNELSGRSGLLSA
jgi:hypothetical protein